MLYEQDVYHLPLVYRDRDACLLFWRGSLLRCSLTPLFSFSRLLCPSFIAVLLTILNRDLSCGGNKTGGKREATVNDDGRAAETYDTIGKGGERTEYPTSNDLNSFYLFTLPERQCQCV